LPSPEPRAPTGIKDAPHEQRSIGQASGIPTRLSEIAYELRDQLVVTYARPQSVKAVEKIEIAVKRRGVKVRSPKWVP
jgi:hypothetical protein